MEIIQASEEEKAWRKELMIKSLRDTRRHVLSSVAVNKEVASPDAHVAEPLPFPVRNNSERAPKAYIQKIIDGDIDLEAEA